jgi:hypothetical protein
LAAANHTLILQSESLSWEHKGMLVVLITLGLYWLGRLLNASTRITKRVENSLANKA